MSISNKENNSQDIMLSTLDNPFNPFTQYDQWVSFDEEQGYNTVNYLARVASSSNNISDSDEMLAITNAIKEILRLNVLGIYVAIKRNSFVDRSKSFLNS